MKFNKYKSKAKIDPIDCILYFIVMLELKIKI